MSSPRRGDFARALMHVGVLVIIALLGDGLVASQGPPVWAELGREGLPDVCFKFRLGKCCSCHSATTQLGPTDSILISAQALFQTGC